MAHNNRTARVRASVGYTSHMLFVFVLMEEGGGLAGWDGASDSYLPSCRAVAVAFVLEVRDGSHHPVVDLGQCQSFVLRALDGFGYQVCVGQVPPGVAAGRSLPRGLQPAEAVGSQRAGGGRRGVRGERGASALLAGGGERSVGRHGAVAALVLRSPSGARRGGTVLLVVLLLGDDVRLDALRLLQARVRSRQRPGAGSGALLGLEVRVDGHVQVRHRLG